MNNIWIGRPSQIVNIGWFFKCFIGALIIIIITPIIGDELPVFINGYIEAALYLMAAFMVSTFIWKLWYIHSFEYQITPEELIEKFGVLNRQKERMAFFRVKDISTETPFYMRPFGLANIILITSDHSSPYVIIKAISNSEILEEKIKHLVASERARNGVREID